MLSELYNSDSTFILFHNNFLLILIFLEEFLEGEPYSACPAQTHIREQLLELLLERRFDGECRQDLGLRLALSGTVREKLLGLRRYGNLLIILD